MRSFLTLLLIAILAFLLWQGLRTFSAERETAPQAAAERGGLPASRRLSGYSSDIRRVVREAGEKVFPSLVYIKAVCSDLKGGRDGASSVSGSGVLISADGEILTNYHVVDKARSVRCMLYDNFASEAEIVGSDKDLDVALLKLKKLPEGKKLPVAELSPERMREGEFVMAMGAPWGLTRSVSIGIISCSRRYLPLNGNYNLWYQIDASISPGNSGGPLIDTRGKVVGINTLGMTEGGTLGFTIPSYVIGEVLERLRKYGRANWAWFGFQLQALHDFDRDTYFEGDKGVIVAGTDPGSPARRGGFLPNDRIIRCGGEEINARNQEDLPDARRRLGLLEFGRPVEFEVIREGRTITLTIAPEEKGKVEGGELALPRWGFSAKAINRFDNPDLYFYAPEGGVFIFGVDYLGNAAEARLERSDIVVSAGGEAVHGLDDLKRVYDRAMKNLKTETRMEIVVLRNGRNHTLVLNYSTDHNKE